jgi:hypothetical protein
MQHSMTISPSLCGFLMNSVLTFKEGLIGYHHLKSLSFSPFAQLDRSMIYLLKSFDAPNHAWVIIPQEDLYPHLCHEGEAHIYYMLKPMDHSPHLLEAHVHAPLWINFNTQAGVQKMVTEPQTKACIVGSVKDLQAVPRDTLA